MKTLENPITKPLRKITYRYVLEKHLVGYISGGVLESDGIFKFLETARIFYYVIKDQQLVGWLVLERTAGWCCYQVINVWVEEKYRGRGIALALYETAIIQDKLVVASGKTQSTASKILWLKMVASDKYNILAWDFKNLDNVSSVWVTDGSLESDFEIYSKVKSEDIRLVATKRKMK